jgi:hypothetical protein
MLDPMIWRWDLKLHPSPQMRNKARVYALQNIKKSIFSTSFNTKFF